MRTVGPIWLKLFFSCLYLSWKNIFIKILMKSRKSDKNKLPCGAICLYNKNKSPTFVSASLESNLPDFLCCVRNCHCHDVWDIYTKLSPPMSLYHMVYFANLFQLHGLLHSIFHLCWISIFFAVCPLVSSPLKSKSLLFLLLGVRMHVRPIAFLYF